MPRSLLIAACSLLGLVLTGCDRQAGTPVIDLAQTGAADPARPAPSRPPAWRLGFEIRISPAEDARQYLPFLAYLEQATGERFRLVFKPARIRIADMLGHNDLDFAIVGAVSYLRARDEYGVRILARGLNPRNRAESRACLVTLPGSPIQRLADLRHRLLAFGRITSSQGHLLPRILLRKAGLTLAELGGHRYTASHQACAEAVLNRRFDACGLPEGLAQRLAQEGKLRIIACSQPYPSGGIAAAPDVPAAVAEKVRRALLAFEPRRKHRAGLYRWADTAMPNGFVAASDAEYAVLEQWMRAFGMLPLARRASGTAP